MNFAEDPILFIDDYYFKKTNKIDLDCENLILKCKNEKYIQSLNEVRVALAEKLDTAKQMVFQRYESSKSKYTEEMLRESIQQIKDELFLDQYCFRLDVNDVIPLFQLKFGILLFSQFDAHLLEDLQWVVLIF